MPEPIRKAFLSAAQDAAEIANPQDRELEARFTRDLAAKNMQIHMPSAAELAKWRERGQQVWSGAKVDQSLVRELQALS
jgi:TRAP-type C4-dicarboxylate transport system substrate-binding protein